MPGGASGENEDNKDADLEGQHIGFEAGIGYGVNESTAWEKEGGASPHRQSKATISRFTRRVNGFL